MKSSFLRMKGNALTALLICASLSGCAITQDGVGADVSMDASYDSGVDYVEPSGVIVGGWAHTYNVAPPPSHFNGGPPINPHQPPGAPHPNPIQGGIHPTPNGNGTHAYKPPPASHSAPSIPTAHHK